MWKIHNRWGAAIWALEEGGTVSRKLIDTIRVVGATCNHIASRKYSKYDFEFDYVIMDEAGKATTAEALVPITLGNNLIFVGDQRQLRPMLTASKEVERWLRKKYGEEGEIDGYDSFDDYFNRPSLFEQVIMEIGDDYKAQLTESRRSHKDQVKLTSKCFYEPFGDKPVTPVPRPAIEEYGFKLKLDTSIVFFDIYPRAWRHKASFAFPPGVDIFILLGPYVGREGTEGNQRDVAYRAIPCAELCPGYDVKSKCFYHPAIFSIDPRISG